MRRTHRTRLLLVTALAAFGATVATAFSFELISPPRKWFQGVNGGPSDLPVTFLINQAGEESVADADNGVTAAAQATEWWEGELENNLNLINVGTTPLNTVGRDGLNITSFNDPARIVRNALAVTIVGWYDDSQSETVNGINFARYDDSDTSFSKRYDFTTEAIGNCSGAFDIQAVQAHEIGHALGLAHSATGAALMYASVGSCSYKRIAADDHDGINTIYNPGYAGGGGGGGGGGCTPTESRLTLHDCSSPSRGPNALVITIGVTDDCGDPVSGAPVTVRLEGQEQGDILFGTADTDSDGTVSFGLRSRDAASVTYYSFVESIGGALPWDSNDPDNTADNPIVCVIN